MGKDKLLWKYLSDGKLSSYFIRMIALKAAGRPVAPELSLAAQADAGQVGGCGEGDAVYGRRGFELQSTVCMHCLLLPLLPCSFSKLKERKKKEGKGCNVSQRNRLADSCLLPYLFI